MRIRKIEADDFRSIYVLNQELGYEYPAEKVKTRIEYIMENTRDIILVAEFKNEVVGYIHGSPYELIFSDSMMNILGFVVKSEHRNSGIGKCLIEAFESHVKASGFSGIRLVSGSDRTSAHKFYEKQGYILRKNQKNYVKNFY